MTHELLYNRKSQSLERDNNGAGTSNNSVRATTVTMRALSMWGGMSNTGNRGGGRKNEKNKACWAKARALSAAWTRSKSVGKVKGKVRFEKYVRKDPNHFQR